MGEVGVVSVTVRELHSLVIVVNEIVIVNEASVVTDYSLIPKCDLCKFSKKK